MLEKMFELEILLNIRKNDGRKSLFLVQIGNVCIINNSQL